MEGSGAEDRPKDLAGKLTRGIIEEVMPSPLIPIEALLELRRLLDSLQTADAKCQRTSQVQDTGQTEPPAAPASRASARRRIPQARKSTDEFQFFQ